MSDILFAQRNCRNLDRVFLADGDVLTLPQKRLVFLLKTIRHYLPWIKRISLYGTARSVRHKSTADLKELKGLGLDRVYMGLESGCPDILRRVKKRDTPEDMVKSAQKVRDARLFLSVTVLLGLGGTTFSSQHIARTAQVLNLMQPRQIAALTLILLPNTQLGADSAEGLFSLPDPQGLLQELNQLIAQLDCRTQFHANHASTYLPLSGRLPKDREHMLEILKLAMSGDIDLVAEQRRAL